MASLYPAFNPFALLLNPAAVLAEVARSERLSLLSSRICRPLDKPVLTGAPQTREDTHPGQDDDVLLTGGTTII